MAAAGTGIAAQGSAAADLGLGADLQKQVQDETNEERKKRLLAQQSNTMSPGATALLGPSMGLTGGGY